MNRLESKPASDLVRVLNGSHFIAQLDRCEDHGKKKKRERQPKHDSGEKSGFNFFSAHGRSPELKAAFKKEPDPANAEKEVSSP